MARWNPLASALVLGGVVAFPAIAQDRPAAPTSATAPAASTDAPLFRPIPTDPADPNYHSGSHRTILRHNPVPTRSSYRSGQGSAGYSNPGGVGRYAEHYDANTLAPNPDYHPVPVAKFDSGGGPSRSEQMAAQQIGIQRDRTIMNHIDTYGRPMGLGYGLGFAGGLGYAYPY